MRVGGWEKRMWMWLGCWRDGVIVESGIGVCVRVSWPEDERRVVCRIKRS